MLFIEIIRRKLCLYISARLLEEARLLEIVRAGGETLILYSTIQKQKSVIFCGESSVSELEKWAIDKIKDKNHADFHFRDERN
jgi:hypothetical protein